ncbi:MAG TPA: hypothetical protein VF466_00230 [Candidatus Saccharimonadales bacterium]
MSKSSASRVPYHLPLAFQPDKKIGAGKDNRVYSLGTEYSRPDLDPAVAARAGTLVVKAANSPNKGVPFTAESALNDVRFKQAKYQLLRHFMGDFIPNSSFFVGQQRQPDGSWAIKPYTLQDRVPQVTLQQLPKEVRNSDELRGEMYGLAMRLRVMHQTLARARAIVERAGDTFVVDAALDLGPFSDYVRDNLDQDPATYQYSQMINGYKDTPNLLVDPETLKLSCVDFGSGEWNGQLAQQLQLTYDITAHDPRINAQLPGGELAQGAPMVGAQP